MLYQSVFALSPAKAEPLLLAPEVKAYRISEKPCAWEPETAWTPC